jgi:two-component system chemotaxis sensor kinase CheA
VLKSDHCSFGLIVDEVQDTADIVVKPLARFLKPISVYSGATVLGDGSIALILDVAGIVKEHILSADSRESSRNQIESNLARKVNEDLQDFLLFKTSGSAKHGILLSYVHRLEEFRRDQIEISNHQRVVRYRNAVLPLISVDRALGLVEASTSIESGLPNALVPVVVIERAGFYYGLEVVEILDVLTTAAPLDLSIATSGGVMGNLVTDQEIVVVLDPYRLIPVREVTSLKPDANVNKRVLYVEDAAFFRSHIRRVLERAGFQVTTANHGEDALALLSSKEREFDIVLSDIEMPVLNGFGLAERIRKNPHLQSLPLVALSTKFDQRHIDTGLKAGFNAYLEKLNGDELVETLRNLTKRSAA